LEGVGEGRKREGRGCIGGDQAELPDMPQELCVAVAHSRMLQVKGGMVGGKGMAEGALG
jgi:phosphoribosylaminoimidazole (AIR) synthetase